MEPHLYSHESTQPRADICCGSRPSSAAPCSHSAILSASSSTPRVSTTLLALPENVLFRPLTSSRIYHSSRREVKSLERPRTPPCRLGSSDTRSVNLLNEHGKRLQSPTEQVSPASRTRAWENEDTLSVTSPAGSIGGTSDEEYEAGGDCSPNLPKYPSLSDLASVIISHNWLLYLVEHDAAERILMGGSKESPLNSLLEAQVDSMFPLYGTYRRAYLPSAAPAAVRKFIIACLYLHYTHIDTAQPGQSSATSIRETKQYDQLHPFLWDDYIRCLTILFPRYLCQCQIEGIVPMSAIQYYQTRVERPLNQSQVLSIASLKAFVSSEAVQPLGAIFTREVVVLQADLMVRRTMIDEQLRAAVANRQRVELEMELLKQRERDLALRRERAAAYEAYYDARSTGTEYDPNIDRS